MALTARFEADFSSFYSAVQQAEVSLKSFEQGAGKVETSLNRMTNSLSGTKVIQDAATMAEAVERVGGVSKLTEAELARVSATVGEAAAKMRAMGIDVPPGMQRIANEIENIKTPAAGLNDRMLTLATAVGTFVGNFAANLLQQGISSIISMGKAAFDSAGHINDLASKTGLSTDSIQRMQFAADQTGGSIEQFTEAAFRLGSRIAGGSGSVQSAVAALGLSFADVRKMAPDQQFEVIAGALGRMDDQTQRNKLGVEIFGKSFSSIAAAVGQGYDEMASKARVTGKAQLDALDEAGDRWAEFTTNLKSGVVSALGNAVLAFDSLKAKMAEWGIGTADSAASTAKLTEEVDRHSSTVRGAAPVVETYTAQLAKVRAEVEALSIADVKEIEAAKALGVSADEITAKFGLTEEALKIVGDRLEANEDKLKKQKAATDAAREANEKFADSVKRITDAQQAQLTTIADKYFGNKDIERARQYVEALVSVENVTKGNAEEQAALAEAMRKGIEAMVAAGLGTEELTNTFEQFRLKATQTGRDVTVAMQATEDAAKRAAAAVAEATGLVIIGQAPTFKPTAGLGFGGGLTSSFGSTPSNLAQRGVVSFGNGGPTAEGPAYLHDDEYVVPKNGALVMRGGGGANITNVFNIVDTEANIARRVSEHLTRSILSGRKVSA